MARKRSVTDLPAPRAATETENASCLAPLTDSPAPQADAATQPQQPETGNASEAPHRLKARPSNGPETGQSQAKATETETGNVLAASAAGQAQPADADSLARAKELRGVVYGRLMKDGRWKSLGLDQLRDDMFRECRAKGIEREAAMSWVYGELDRLYPPLPPQPNEGKAQALALLDSPKSIADSDLQSSATRNSGSDSGRVHGLGDLPPAWPELPANASLAAEIGWVQANRLYVVEELPAGGTRVRLDKAHEPAPSRAAIGWLETSVRSYAKFIEVAAKVTGAGQDEQDQAKRERMALDEVRALLAEMLQ